MNDPVVALALRVAAYLFLALVALGVLALVLWLVSTVLTIVGTMVTKAIEVVAKTLGWIIGPIDDWIERKLPPFWAWLARLALLIAFFLGFMGTLVALLGR